jgi:cobalt-zinc-cadmium efflux system protein
MDDKKAMSALKLGIVLTAIFFVMELVGGYISGSLSLLSDAGHMFRDVLALVLSLAAIRLALRLPSKGRTFGYHRVEVLVALLNGIMLLVISIWIFWEAYHRIREP